MKKTKTVKIKQNIEYARVADRVAEFVKNHPNATIKTDVEFKEGHALFRATIIPDAKHQERFFNGTSLGKVGAEKALEKLETIAVGRALAFAGYLSTGEIASAEEMVKYEETVIQIDTNPALMKLESCTTIEELQKTWRSLSQAERDNKEVATLKDELKATLTSNHENTQDRAADAGVAGA